MVDYFWSHNRRGPYFVGYMVTMERKGRGYQLIRTAPPLPGCSAALRGRWAWPIGEKRAVWAGRVSPKRRRWAGKVSLERRKGAGHTSSALYDDPAHILTTNDRKRPLNQEDTTLKPTFPAASQGVSLTRITDKDFLITRSTRHIEYLHIFKVLSAPKKASSARSVDLVHEPAICCDWPEPGEVLRHHHNNKIRMLAHRWKRLGLQEPVSSGRNDQTPEQSHRKNQLAMKTGQDAAQEENKDTHGLHCLTSSFSTIGLLEEKVHGKHSSSNRSGSSECQTASDLSDHEQESIQISSWAAAVKLDLKPEPFDEDHHFTETVFYPEVLPASLMHSTQNLSSETQESLFVTDPCLVPVIARLMELERLQAATVEKERAKLGRSRPITASTRNGNRSKKSEPSGCKTGISKDTEFNSVMCNLSKLTVCSNYSCRDHICPSTKSGQGSKSKLPHPALPKCPDSLSGKCKKAETVLPTFSVSVKVPHKNPEPKRIKSPKTQRRSTSAKVPNRKT